MATFLGIDVGTSATKALLCDHKGAVLATASAEHPIHTPRPGWSEQDPRDWWTSSLAALHAACKKAKVKPDQVDAIGLSGQMHGSVFVDKAGKSLRRALLWNDQRTAAQCLEIEEKAGGRAALIDMVNNVALTGFTAPKILWVRQHDPRTYEKTFKILLPKDYIRLRLTGELASEVSDASGTLLLDVRHRVWSTELLGKLQIDAALMPRLYESIEITGTVAKSAAKQTGLREGVPVVGGAGDQPAGAVGNGIVRPGIVSATFGTSGVVFAHSDAPVSNPEGVLQSFCHAVPGKWCVFGCMLSAGGSLQHVRNMLFADKVKALRKAKKDPCQLYPVILEEAAHAPVGCEGLFFLPYLTGERCPYADPTARGGWIGLTVRHTRADLLRAVVEGITFGMRDQVELFRQLGTQIAQIRAGGGGARSAFWRQMQADMFKAPVVTINTQEGAAYGVALLAATSKGAYPALEQACAKAIRITSTARPRKSVVALYDQMYPQYRDLYRSLKDDFRKISSIIAGSCSRCKSPRGASRHP
jgi:xylulokinase